MRLLICGSRDYKRPKIIRTFLYGMWSMYREELEIIHGGARGADQIAEDWAGARLEDKKVWRFPADWKKHGKRAGPIRNREMMMQARPNMIFAFKDDFDWSLNSGGTEDMVKVGKENGVPTYVVQRVS